jgi:cytochrome c2
MIRYKKFMFRFLASLIFIGFISNNNVFAQDGKALFTAQCANCHKVDGDYTGPHIKGVRDRSPADWVYKWVANPAGTNDPYATALKIKWKPTIMNAFPALKKAEIDAILDYVDTYVAPPKPEGAKESGSDNSLLFGILTLILAVVAFILLQVNSNLRKLSDDKEGIYRGEPVPFYRNKSYLMMGVLGLAGVGMYFTMAGYNGSGGGMNLGRMQNYQPEQPIYYSHKVHAGTNQISCLYCHGGTQDSKSGSIPSVNVCMNCHMAIKEYKGEAITKADGSSVNGTAEIQKLYAYAGWNPEKKEYNPDKNKDGIPDGAT